MELATGIEPATSGLQIRSSTVELRQHGSDGARDPCGASPLGVPAGFLHCVGRTPGTAQHGVVSPIMGRTTATTTPRAVVDVCVVERFMAFWTVEVRTPAKGVSRRGLQGLRGPVKSDSSAEGRTNAWMTHDIPSAVNPRSRHRAPARGGWCVCSPFLWRGSRADKCDGLRVRRSSASFISWCCVSS